MPNQLVSAVAHSHDVEALDIEPEQQLYFRIIAMSGQLADAWLLGGDEVALKRASVSVEKYFGITPNKLADMFEIMKDQLPATEDMFEMELFDATQLIDISDAAREVLMIRNLHTLSDAMDLQKKASSLQSENYELRQETTLDGLTGVGNRRFFEDSLTKEFESASHHKWPLSLIFIDIDCFKEINDSHGHPAGDEILREIAKMITATIRSEDIVARYGGDEFVVLLPGCDAEAASRVANRLVSEAVNCGAKIESTGITPTLSLGVVTMNALNNFETPKELLTAADQALYCSKKAGRNRHTCYEKIKVA
jgi:diguanylate cyclase (GGDEF)-like protein